MFNDSDFNFLDLELLDNLPCLDIDFERLLYGDSIPTYRTKPIEQWDNEDVLDFIHNETHQQFDQHSLQRFKSISGYIFSNLTKDHCKILSNSSYIGEAIFTAKEFYISCNGTCRDIKSEYNEEQKMQCDEGMERSVLYNSSELSRYQHQDSTRRKPGRPRSRSKVNEKLGKRSQKLWEFLLHLLESRDTCPKLIKWENFQEGTFKFVQSDKVAQLWGNRKKNENMTYEKFSRAMRYYYKSQVLLPVPGRRLVYKFGPQATGWQNVQPII